MLFVAETNRNSPDGAVGGIELSDDGKTGDDRVSNTKDANRLEIEQRPKMYKVKFRRNFEKL